MVLINQAYNSTYHHFQVGYSLFIFSIWITIIGMEKQETRKTEMDPPVLNIFELAKGAPCSTF